MLLHNIRFGNFWRAALCLAIVAAPTCSQVAQADQRGTPYAGLVSKIGLEPNRGVLIDDILADIAKAEDALLRLPTLPKVDETALVNVEGAHALLEYHKNRLLALRPAASTPEVRQEIEQIAKIVKALKDQVRWLHKRFIAGDNLDVPAAVCGPDMPCPLRTTPSVKPFDGKKFLEQN